MTKRHGGYGEEWHLLHPGAEPPHVWCGRTDFAKANPSPTETTCLHCKKRYERLPVIDVVVLEHRSFVGCERWSIHRKGCAEIEREARKNASERIEIPGTNAHEAARHILDIENRPAIEWDMGNIRVHPCAVQAPKAGARR